MSAAGNPAGPFYFMLTPENGGYHIYGEGTGSKAASDEALKELSALKANDIAALLAQARAASPNGSGLQVR
jgi:hypothetical protein